MSQATASAKARRAFTPTTAPPAPQNSQSNTGVNAQGLTLPQVISIIDNRLVTLETFMKDEKSKSTEPVSTRENVTISPVNDDLLSEFNHRTTVLAEELANLKDIVLKLQAYTMDVNKTLYEERIHVLSDLGEIQSDVTEPVTEKENDKE